MHQRQRGDGFAHAGGVNPEHGTDGSDTGGDAEAFADALRVLFSAPPPPARTKRDERRQGEGEGAIERQQHHPSATLQIWSARSVMARRAHSMRSRAFSTVSGVARMGSAATRATRLKG